MEITHEEQKEYEQTIKKIRGTREEAPFSRNEITQANYLEIKVAKSKQQKVDAMYSYVQEELATLKQPPPKVDSLLTEHDEWAAASGGGKLTDNITLNKRFEILQKCIRIIQPLRGYEPDEMEEEVAVKGEDGRDEGHAPAQKSFALVREIEKRRKDIKEVSKGEPPT